MPLVGSNVERQENQMDSFRAMFAKLRRDERGATAIEYGLIAALVSVVIIGAITAMGDGLVSTFNEITTELGGTPAT